MSHRKVASPPRQTPRCERCDTKFRGKGDWNVRAIAGRVLGLICPRCQTADENAQAAINDATLVYDSDRVGRIVARPKVGA